MKPKRKVEKAIRERLRFTACPTLRDRLLTEVMNAQEGSIGIRPALHGPGIGRRIMRSRIAKLTSIAAMVALAALAVTFWSRSSSSVYAIEDTVAALENVRFLHIVGRDEAGQINDERWIEVGEDGYQVRYRQQHPPSVVAEHPGSFSMVIEDGVSTAVYHQDKKAVILYDRNDQQFQWISDLGKFFENLRTEGKILKENDEYQGRRAHKVWWPALNSECYIDPETKLPIAFGRTGLSYEEPPAGTFEIVIPEGYAVLDKRPGAPAAAAPDWLVQEENAHVDKEKSFNQGAKAIIRGDYAEAARLLEQGLGTDSWCVYWLGKAYYELGQYDQAIKNFDAIFDTFKKLVGGDTIPFCQYARGLAYARLGMQEQAKADLQACLPVMIKTLRTPSGGVFFEYADNPQLRYGYKPSEQDMVAKMINRLRIVSGRNFGYDPAGTKEQNETAIACWEQWFKADGQIQVTPDAPQVEVLGEWISRLGWGRKSNQQIISKYDPTWQARISDWGLWLKIGFALYDGKRYDDALAVFQNLEKTAADDQHKLMLALVWEGHMLDLLGKRPEAIAKYEKVAGMGMNDGEQRHDQFGLTYFPSPYAKERMTTPFVRVENQDEN
jgi:tetratricopeptide (TPR) repeat protein